MARTRALLAALLACGALLVFAGPAHAASHQTPETTSETPSSEPSLENLDQAPKECIESIASANSIDVKCQEAPNQLVPEKNEIIWGAIGFLVVFFGIAKFGYPAVKKTMDARSAAIRTDLEAAESAKGEAQSVLDDYRAQLADAKGESARIIEEARQQADALRKDQEQRLQTELAEMRTRAAADVESAKVQAIADLRGEVANLAIGAAEVVVQRNLDRPTQTQLVENYINQVGSRSN